MKKVRNNNLLATLYRLYRIGRITYKFYLALKKSSKKRQISAVRKYSTSWGGTRRRPHRMNVRKEIKKIKKHIENDRAVHIHRKRDVGRMTAAANTAVYLETRAGGTITNLELAMANLRYFNPATNALVTQDPSAVTFHNDVLCSVYSKLLIQNNYQSKADVRVYCLRPKSDTSVGVDTYFTSGLADQANPNPASPLIYPTDSEILKEMWSIVSSKHYVLNAGDKRVMNLNIKQFSYDPSQADTHSDAFQKKYNGYTWYIRVTGCISHDTVANQQGFGTCGIDLVEDVTFRFVYDAGKDLKDYSIDDNSDSFSNSPVYSCRPVSDNIGYSIP